MNQSRWSLRRLSINILLLIVMILFVKNCTDKLFFSSIQPQIIGRWRCIEQDTSLYAKEKVTLWMFNQRGELTVIRELSGQSSSGRYFLLSENQIKIKWRNRNFTIYDISFLRNQLTISSKSFRLICHKT